MKRLIAKKSFKNKVNNIKLLMDLMYNNIKEAKIYPSVLGDALESLLEDNNKQKILGLLDEIRN